MDGWRIRQAGGMVWHVGRRRADHTYTLVAMQHGRFFVWRRRLDNPSPRPPPPICQRGCTCRHALQIPPSPACSPRTSHVDPDVDATDRGPRRGTASVIGGGRSPYSHRGTVRPRQRGRAVREQSAQNSTERTTSNSQFAARREQLDGPRRSRRHRRLAMPLCTLLSTSLLDCHSTT